MRYYDERVEASRNFANKIWNASRFLMMNLNIDKVELPSSDKLALEDKWILSKLNKLVAEVTANLDKFELGIAVSKLYGFFWDDYCDWYIELVKPRLYDGSDESNKTAQQVLAYVLINSLKLLHPFMPFITEEIFSFLPHGEESIVISKWPEYTDNLVFEEDEKRMAVVMGAIRGVRNLRTQMNVPPSKRARITIVTDNTELFAGTEKYFEKLAGASETVVASDMAGIDENAVNTVVEGATVYIPLDDLVDREKEVERLTKEQATLISEIKRAEGKLNNAGFVDKAPEKVVNEEREKLAKYKDMLAKVEESLTKLKG